MGPVPKTPRLFRHAFAHLRIGESKTIRKELGMVRNYRFIPRAAEACLSIAARERWAESRFSTTCYLELIGS